MMSRGQVGMEKKHSKMYTGMHINMRGREAALKGRRHRCRCCCVVCCCEACRCLCCRRRQC